MRGLSAHLLHRGLAPILTLLVGVGVVVSAGAAAPSSAIASATAHSADALLPPQLESHAPLAVAMAAEAPVGPVERTTGRDRRGSGGPGAGQPMRAHARVSAPAIELPGAVAHADPLNAAHLVRQRAGRLSAPATAPPSFRI